MKEKIKKLIYIPTFGEEVANTVSHGVMAVLVLIALPFCAVWAYIHGTANPILASASVSVFMLSIFMMLLCSTLYHAMSPESKHKAVFHILDHIMIYIAIAGSYTPHCTLCHWRLARHSNCYHSVGYGAVRCLLQVVGKALDTLDKSYDLLDYGLDDCNLLPTLLATSLYPTPRAHRCGRHILHPRCLLLREKRVSLPPPRLAYSHRHSDDLPRHRYRLLPLLITGEYPTHLRGVLGKECVCLGVELRDICRHLAGHHYPTLAL